MTSAAPKLQHYVPRVYLQGFADPRNPRTVWLYERGALGARSQGIANTAAETYYYSLELPGGEKDNVLETEFLAPIESAVKPVLDHLRSDPRAVLEKDHLQPLASFMVAMYGRSPRSRRTFERSVGGLLKTVTRKRVDDDAFVDRFLTAYPDIGLSRERFREIAAHIDDPNIEIRLNKSVLVGMQFLHLDRLYPFFVDKNWSLLTCSGDPEFITCDSPLSVFCLNKDGTALIGAGLIRPDAEIVLPVSPHCALRLSYRPQPRRQAVSRRVVQDINRRLVYQAERYVYASRRSRTLGEFIGYWFAHRAEFSLDPIAMDAYADRFIRARRERRSRETPGGGSSE